MVKLNKDLFLVPTRYINSNSQVDPEEDPYFILAGSLPMMFKSEEELAAVESLGGTTGQIVTVAIVIPIAAAVALKGVLSKLWAMLNTLQLINSLSILTIEVPNNVMKVQEDSY